MEIRVDDTLAWHPAYPLLQAMARGGVPVKMTSTSWTTAELDARAQRGSHQSCQAHIEFVREEMAEFVKKGYWLVLPYSLVRDLKGLRLSPLGVVPQRERRPRLIVDYTYYGVNQENVI